MSSRLTAAADTEAASRAEALRQRFALERAVIDASTRGPVLFYYASSVFWLLTGSLFAIIASAKLHSPEFHANPYWTTFGRIRPAHMNTVIFGWAVMAGIGTLLWLIARLARTPLRFPGLVKAACVIWNIGVAVGTYGIFAGQSTGIEWLEFPPYTPPILVTSLLMVCLSAYATFARRREPHIYVTLWYALGAFFWLPTVYITATLLCVYFPAPGVVQAATNWWFAHNVLGLWLTPVGVGAAYYFIPKVIGRPIYSYHLSIVGFWALALFYSWAGIHHLIGGPLPKWLVSASVVGSVMMFIPVIAVALNHHMTMRGHFRELRFSPTLRFVVFGAVTYTAVSFQGSIEALRWFNRTVHFTHYTVAHAHLGVYGFFSMVMFGAMYYVVPRLTGREWVSAFLIRVHFWSCALGIALYFISLSVGGWLQGTSLLNADIPFIRVVLETLPYLWSRTAGGILMTIGHLAFALLYLLNMMGAGASRRGETMFRQEFVREPALASGEIDR